MYCVLYFTLEKKNISDWPKSGPVETGPTGPVATPLSKRWMDCVEEDLGIAGVTKYTRYCYLLYLV